MLRMRVIYPFWQQFWWCFAQPVYALSMVYACRRHCANILPSWNSCQYIHRVYMRAQLRRRMFAWVLCEIYDSAEGYFRRILERLCARNYQKGKSAVEFACDAIVMMWYSANIARFACLYYARGVWLPHAVVLRAQFRIGIRKDWEVLIIFCQSN